MHQHLHRFSIFVCLKSDVGSTGLNGGYKQYEPSLICIWFIFHSLLNNDNIVIVKYCCTVTDATKNNNNFGSDFCAQRVCEIMKCTEEQSSVSQSKVTKEWKETKEGTPVNFIDDARSGWPMTAACARNNSISVTETIEEAAPSNWHLKRAFIIVRSSA
jgi:hypothetical protein